MDHTCLCSAPGSANSTTGPTVTAVGQSDEIDDQEVEQLKLPSYLKAESWRKWCTKRKWLRMKDQKVICHTCSKTNRSGLGITKNKSLRLDSAFLIGVQAKNRKKLLKKIDEHSASASHTASEAIESKSHEEVLRKSISKATSIWTEVNKEKILATGKVFNVAYMCAKEDLPFTKHPKLVELMEKNGMPRCSMLFSEKACSSIIEHIASEMQKKLISYLKNTDIPFSVLVDESTTLSSKTALIIYVRVAVHGDICNYFYDLIELSDGATGVNIAQAIFDSLKCVGEETITKNLVGLATDGASVMRGEKSGAVAILRTLVKSELKAFHCMAHKMELAVNMATKSSGEVQRFGMFVASLYAFYHRSPKNMYELQSVAEGLSVSLLAVTEIFTVRWVASSYRAVKAVESDFSALFNHFTGSANDYRRSSQDRAKCGGFARKMKSWNFVAEMLLLLDTLEVLWHLSSYLQLRSASLIDAQSKVSVAINTLSAMKTKAGNHVDFLKTTDESVCAYQGVVLTRSNTDREVKIKVYLSID
jgi:hypothetical protein